MSRLRDVMFVSQAMAEALAPDASAAMLSITDRGAAPALLKPGWAAVLRLQFNDVDTDEDPWDETEIELGEITVPQAEAIAGFVRQVAPVARAIVVHCRFGQSRSPAVARAICRHLQLHFPPDFHTHNKLVERLVAEALARQPVA